MIEDLYDRVLMHHMQIGGKDKPISALVINLPSAKRIQYIATSHISA